MKGKIKGAVVVLTVCLLSISTVGTAIPGDLREFHGHEDALSLSGNEQLSSPGVMNMTGPGIVWRAQLGGPIGMAISSDGTSYVSCYKDHLYTSDPDLEKRSRDGGWGW
jgi:hypothetical protein